MKRWPGFALKAAVSIGILALIAARTDLTRIASILSAISAGAVAAVLKLIFVFASDMGLPLTVLDCLLLIPPIMPLSAIPISISGWEVREGVMIGALATMGIGTEQALALSVLLGFALLANGLIGVLPLAFGGDRFVAVRGCGLEPSQVGDRAP